VELGVELDFKGRGVDEIAIVKSISGGDAPSLSVGDVVVRIDPRYFRPAEVETLLGDPLNAKQKLGWEPKITVQDMCSEMIQEDLKVAKKYAFMRQNGFDVPVAQEG
jgi:GDPmannose 4,6-dehydratase